MKQAHGVHAPDLSVVIITLNEAANLRRCLASLPSGIELVVVDSGSSDATVAIAEGCGARVVVRPFDDFASQKNFAIALATRPWILSIDADEELSPDLARAIARATSSQDLPGTAARLRRHLVFQGRRLRFGKAVDAPVRLFRRGGARFIAAIHERLEVTGNTCDLGPGELRHYSYRDLTDYFRRFNTYTTMVARNHHQFGHRGPSLLSHALRPWWEFFSRYLLRGGFLDGYPGYTYALLSSVYTYVKYAKLRELVSAAQEPGRQGRG